MHDHTIYDWAFNIMHEFVFQFQGFRQYRTSSSGKRKEEDWKILRQNLDVTHNIILDAYADKFIVSSRISDGVHHVEQI